MYEKKQKKKQQHYLPVICKQNKMAKTQTELLIFMFIRKK